MSHAINTSPTKFLQSSLLTGRESNAVHAWVVASSPPPPPLAPVCAECVAGFVAPVSGVVCGRMFHCAAFHCAASVCVHKLRMRLQAWDFRSSELNLVAIFERTCG